jgi:hypothetical protein
MEGRTNTALSSGSSDMEDAYADKVQIRALEEEIRRLSKKQQFFEDEQRILALKKRLKKLREGVQAKLVPTAATSR